MNADVGEVRDRLAALHKLDAGVIALMPKPDAEPAPRDRPMRASAGNAHELLRLGDVAHGRFSKLSFTSNSMGRLRRTLWEAQETFYS